MQGARPDTGGYVARSDTSGKQRMPYRLFVPKGYDKTKRYPLIVWLHGAGGAGSDNLRQISEDQVPGTRLWVKAENQAKHPAFVVAPQSDSAWTTGIESPGLQPDPRLVSGILDALSSEFPIDRTRVYLLGQSLGATAAWNLATNNPDRFAAVLLVCPSLRNVTRSSRAARLPLWVFQGDKDSLIVTTRELVDAVTRSGGRPRFTVYPNEGHDIWTRVFAEPGLVEWLFAQAR